ncbi:uncharacterized protein B0H18DRAFT_1027060 [Fomitopsis serialis]|uniref:uncharacterized protein n=1 Tax=Fomitopsis serialis TaxID=139415 RepID=UPI00200799A8|nr:uncharacterized protein B0H18DRAFT_1027060 [Neoantrodia serialis]KAH9919600.1 hypothetical protein B0H18DRAFT_1027060 [Neoantrodia serialis]
MEESVVKGLPAPRKLLDHKLKPTRTTPRPKVAMLVTGDLDPGSFKFLDTLHIREEVTYITTSSSQIEDVGAHVERATVVSAESFLRQYESKSYDALFIPGQQGEPQCQQSTCSTIVQTLYDDHREIIATGSGRLLIISTGLTSSRRISSISVEVSGGRTHSRARGNTDSTPENDGPLWEDIEIIRDGYLWTASSAEKTLTSLAFLFKAAWKGDMACSVFPVHSRRPLRDDGGQDDTPSSSSPPSTDAATELADKIAETPLSEAENLPSSVTQFAVRLGLEGFVSSCNLLMLTLLSVFPDNAKFKVLMDAIDGRALELVWHYSAQRPALPWDAPSEDEIEKWEKASQNAEWYPSIEDLGDTLESVKVRMRLDDENWTLPPYSLAGAISMAIDAGWENEAHLWLSSLVRTATPDVWSAQLEHWPKVVKLAINGVVAEATGRSSDDAERDAAIVRRALLSFPETSAAVEEQRHSIAQRVSLAPLPSLLPMLDVLKWDQDEKLLKPPASPSAIHKAEVRLGVQLPEDYKQFLQLSNGLGPTTVNRPGLKPVEQLLWEDPDRLGLEWFHVDLGCNVHSSPNVKLPKPGRVLMLSDDHSEESMWLVEPGFVSEAIHALKGHDQSDDALDPSGWRLVVFIAWSPEIIWPKSFRAYIEDLAKDAHRKAGAMPVFEHETLQSRL